MGAKMKAWFFEGPMDGLEIEVPALVELVVFAPSVDGNAVTYRHLGQPGDPDCRTPEVGQQLTYCPDEITIAPPAD